MAWIIGKRVSHRIAAAFGVLVALLFVMAAIAWYANQAATAESHRIQTVEFDIRRGLLEWNKLSELNGERTLLIAALGSDELAAMLKPRMAEVSGRIGELQKQIEQQVVEPDGRALLDEAGRLRTTYLAARKTVESLAAGNDRAQTTRYSAETLRPALQAYLDAQHRLADWKATQIAARSVEAERRAALRTWLLIGLCVTGAACALAFWRLLVRSIVGPIRQAGAVARAIAGGDLSQRVAAQGADELAELIGALDAMQSSLRGFVGEVHGNAESVAVAARQIAQGNQDLSSRTEHQAASLQQTSSSMVRMTSLVEHNSGAAHQAKQLAGAASEEALRGGDVVGRVVATMGGISAASRRIADIIAVIDGIAFQTNILALNAAVEAARAGEQGRGFAVVSGEVRALAQRSAQAAREIKGLIGDSVERVEGGARLVNDAGATMGEIVARVRRVADLIGEITAGSDEQSSGIVQVNRAVEQLDRMTQQNAALVEESAAAAQSLRDQAVQLAQAVSVFRLGAAQPA